MAGVGNKHLVDYSVPYSPTTAWYSAERHFV